MFSPEDSSDISIAATYIKFSDYMQLWQLIEASNTTHSGMRTLSLLITAEYSAWEWYSPIITFIIILLLPSALTFLTLLIHRIRAARAAQRDRAPEGIVHGLPWCVWTGTGWEKHEGLAEAAPPTKVSNGGIETHPEDPANESENADCNPSTSHDLSRSAEHPWFESQVECAICLSEFVKGDRVRILPCHHLFHMDEVDSWLIQRKKLCPICKADVTKPAPNHPHQTAPTERTPLLRQDHEAQP
jgi:E3 ubiquitin-protein ligase RNF13/E3 ubiquitin-protein ligase RNF167